MSTELKEKALSFIKAHPKMSYVKFEKMAHFNISSRYYYVIRNEVFSKGTRTNNKSLIFVTITAIPSKDLTPQTKDLIANMLKAINVSQGTRLEGVENLKTQTIEIRQVGIK